MNLIIAIFIDELFKQTSLAESRKKKQKEEKRRHKVQVCRDAILDFDTDHDGVLSSAELLHVLDVLELNKDLCLVFEDVGVPLSMIRDEMEVFDDNLDVQTVLDMVTTATNPTTRRDTFELRYRIEKSERATRLMLQDVDRKLEMLTVAMSAQQKQMTELHKLFSIGNQ